MALAVRFAIHHEQRRCAVFVAGDERFRAPPLPEGWEELMQSEIIRGERALARWRALDLYERLCGLCPPGFQALRAIK